jgi:predicted transcriptional regulator
MNYKKYILEILRDHQPMTLHQFDRLFYENNTRLVSWLSTVKELIHDQMIKEEPLRITSKGIHELEKMTN